METPRRFKKIKIGLMRSPLMAELSGVMMLGTTKLDDECPTAYTNGRDEVYGTKFIEAFGDKEVGFVIVHENMHKGCRHLTLYKGLMAINAQVTNEALDYWINGKLVKLDPRNTLIKMPMKGEKVYGLYDAKYDGWTVKRIFDHLLENPEEQGGGCGPDGEGEGGLDEHDWEGANSLTKEEQAQLEEDVKQAIRQGQMVAKGIGNGSNLDPFELGELLKPVVRWEDELRQFITQSCANKDRSTWRRPNRRFLHMDIIMPTLEGESMREIVLAIDASGSMYGKRQLKAISEVKGIADAVNIDKVHVLYWDGKVADPHEEYTMEGFRDFHLSTSPYCGGGTTPACIGEYMKEKQLNPECVVVLTDGEIGDWGTWNVPILWAITEAGTTAPVGKTITITD